MIKKLVLCIMLILIPAIGFAGWSGNLEAGCSFETGDFYTGFQIAYGFPMWLLYVKLYGGIEILMEKSENFTLAFCPYRDTYKIGGQINYRNIYLKLEHFCTHPVWSTKEQFERKAFQEDQTRLGIGIEFK